MSLFKNAGRLGDSGWGQTLPSADLTQDMIHQLSSLLFHAPEHSYSCEINWLIIINYYIIGQFIDSTTSPAPGPAAGESLAFSLCDSNTASKHYTWNLSLIQTLDQVQLAVVNATASNFVKQE